MTEQICWETTENLLPIVQALNCPSGALMMLERVPNTFLPNDERQKGICLRKYDKDENFETWEYGRIFHNDFELRWEKHDGVFVAVYIGKLKALPMPNTKSLSDFEIQDDSYYLWGEKMTVDTLKLINQSEIANLFLELQIPRLLCYPVSNRNEKVRVKIAARQYLNSETGTLEFYRFRHLEELS